MKKYIHTLIFLVCTFATFAQAPQKFNYQAVARNAQGTVLSNQNVKIRASILDGSANGTSQYTETHNVTTSQLGLFNLAIGGGTVVSGAFINVTWANGNKFLKIEMDATGGNNFSLVGTSQLLSVPYALNAGNGSQWTSVTNGIQYEDNVVIGSSPNPAGTNGIIQVFADAPEDGAIAIERGELRMSSETVLSIDAPFEVGGRLVVNESGNVGIGIPNPTAKFEIVGDYDAANNITPTFRVGGFGGAVNHLSTNTPMVFNVAPDAGYGFVFRSTEFGNLGNYTDLVRITPNGRVGIGRFTGFVDPSPRAELHINDGDVYLDNPSKGVIMKSPNGQCWRMTVTNTGQPQFTSVTCPQ